MLSLSLTEITIAGCSQGYLGNESASSWIFLRKIYQGLLFALYVFCPLGFV